MSVSEIWRLTNGYNLPHRAKEESVRANLPIERRQESWSRSIRCRNNSNRFCITGSLGSTRKHLIRKGGLTISLRGFLERR